MDLRNNIILTYSPAADEKDRICGHTFEVMDYYLLLKENGFNPKILILDKIKPEKIFKVYEEKYNIPFDYKNDLIFEKINLINNKKYNLFCDTIIITSGLNYFWTKKINLFSKKTISFQCEFFDYDKYLDLQNFYLLRDHRIYKNDNNSDYFYNDLHYIKKINFKYYKSYKINNTNDVQDNTIIYVNGYLKDLNENELKRLYYKYKKLIFVSGTRLNELQIKKYQKYGNLLYAPVENLFEIFTNFIYTSNTRNFDCSPRFITECKFYNKNIYIETDLTHDKGAYYRWLDIQNNFENLKLKNDDLILKILRNEVNNDY